MIPILYKSDEVDFYDNGLGALTEIYDVDVQEQRNGLFTLTATYPVSGQRYKDIEVGRIIYAKPNQNDDPQAFRIVHTELDISGYNLTIEADHITYDLTHNMVKKVHLQGDGQNAMTALQNATTAPHMFRFVSDLQHIGDSTLQYVNPMEAIAGTQGSILQIWGGELKRGNRTVSMLSRRGRDNFTTFRLGKNINGLKYTVDTANLVTRIIPTITQTNAVNKEYFIAGDSVDSTNIQKYPNVYIQHVDMGDEVTVEENESEDSIKAKINAKAKNWFTQSANTHVDLPQITVEIDVTSLQDSADYQDEFKNLEAIELTDTVTVYVPEFGVNVQAIVNELHFDPMTERVTSIVVGTSKTSFVDANANQFSALENQINQIRQDAVTAIVSSNGKNTNYYSNKEPEHPVEGDLWFKQVGDDMYIMVFKDGHWVELVSTRTQEMIEKAVDDAIKQANAYTDELNEKQAKEVQDFRTKYDKELDDAKTERDGLDKKISEIDDSTTQKLVEASEDRKRIEDKATQLVLDANDHAQELADNAVATAKAEAGKALQDANSALEQAKTDLNGKVQDVHSETVKNATEIAGKVSQSDYDAKTKDLDTKYSQVKATADGVKTDVANYKKSTDGKIQANTSEINSLSNEIDLKVTKTDYDNDQKTVNGNVSKIQLDAEKALTEVAEVTAKVNDLGQVNQLFNTEFTPDLEGWSASNNDITYAGVSKSVTVKGSNVLNITHGSNTNWSSYRQQISNFVAGATLSASVYARATSTGWGFAIDSFSADGTRTIVKQVTITTTNTLLKIENVTIPADANNLYFSFWGNTAGTAVIYKPMLVFDDHIGGYVQGNYNNNSRVSALEVSLDGITQTVNDPKNGLSAVNKLASDSNTLAIQAQKDAKTADGKAVKAQNDATTAVTTAQGTQTTVTSVQKDVKDVQTQQTQTAKQITTEINDRKSGDNAVETRMKDLVNTQITSVTNGYTSLNQQTEQSFKTQIKNVTDQVNAMGQINQLMNTEFTPDLSGWDMSETSSGVKVPYRQYIYQGSNMLTFDSRNQADKKYSSIKQTIPFAISGSNRVVSLSWWSRVAQGDLYASTHIRSYDSNMTKLTDVAKSWDNGSDMTLNKFENVAIPDEARFVEVTFAVREGYLAFLTKPMFTYRETTGDYVPGIYNNNDLVESTRVQLNNLIKDQINNVKDQISTTKTQTDNQITNEINDRKNGDSTLNTQLRNYIGTQVTSVTNGYQSAIEQSANAVIASVSMPNKLVNTEFSPDLEGWTINNPLSGTGNPATIYTSNGYGSSNGLRINAYTNNNADANAYYYVQQRVNVPSNISVASFHAMGYIYAISDNGYAYVNANIAALDKGGNNIGAIVPGTQLFDKTNTTSWQESSSRFINMSIPAGTDSLQISIYARGQTSVNISQPILTFSRTAGTYTAGAYNNMGTSTVLSLFKDNWALGIADNAGKIISGINGDKTGTVIQGKKLVIDSDTTINGKAFIDGAVIKNGSIGKAQIGSASIGNAQIIDVDVSKISGNIANFITGNIRTLNAKVLYGNTGHLGVTDTGVIINNQDDHLQLAAHGQYDADTKRSQLELLGYANNIDSNMRGSLNYYKNPHNKGTGLGIRFYGNQILAIDEAVSTGNLYLSPYASGQVQIVNRDRNGFQDIKASNFVTSSERKYKSDIKSFDVCALDIVKKTKIRQYIKNDKPEIGVIADEAPEQLLTEDGKGITLYDYTSVLYKAVQELSQEVEDLKNERA